MPIPLTARAAADLGRSLRFIRMAKELSLRDVAKAGGLSAQYIYNLEKGDRLAASDEGYQKFAHGLGVTEDVVMNLLLKARIMAELERQGLTPEQTDFVWTGVEQRLEEIGHSVKTNVDAYVPAMMRTTTDR